MSFPPYSEFPPLIYAKYVAADTLLVNEGQTGLISILWLIKKHYTWASSQEQVY